MKPSSQNSLGSIIFIVNLLAALHLSAPAQNGLLVPLAQSWRYTTNNLDGLNWQGITYDDSTWSNAGPALFYIETAALPAPTNTPLPGREDGDPMPTYYFRTTFNVLDPAKVASLTFSNLIDDGAIFYLNGQEVQRVGVANTNMTYESFADRLVNDATSFDLFTLSGEALTNLVAGTNLVAAEVHQVNSTSSDVVFGAAVLAATNLNLTRGPYLQNGSHTNLTIRWRTDANSVGKVFYGTELANLNLSASEGGLTNEHQVTLRNLQPDTKYFYAIGTANRTLAGSNANHYWITSPLPGAAKPTRIWVIGDAGTANASQVAVRNAYENFTGTRETDLWLMLGDNAYNSGTDLEYQRAVFNMYTNLLRKSVVWPTLGNHETAQATAYVDTYPYFNIFTLPKNGEAGGLPSGTEHYYSFDYGNIHFVCLDSMTANRSRTGPMATWLTNDLANTTADWIIAFFHHPPYTKGSHNSDSYSDSTGALVQMRTNLIPLLEAGGVDLVLSGHSHSYERSLLIDQHYSYSTGFSFTNKIDGGNGRENGSGAYRKPEGGPIAHQGTIYAVVGSSGQTSGGALNHPAMFVSLNNLGSMVLDISSNRLDAKFIRENGATNDYFTILKLNYPPVASNLVTNVEGDVASTFVVTGSDINRDQVYYVPIQAPAHGRMISFNPLTGSVGYLPAHGFRGADSFQFGVHDGKTNSAPALVTLNVAAPVDVNHTGLPDYWENDFGVLDALADDDFDGLNNAEEYWANTNPTNASSRLQITQVQRAANGHCALSWSAIGGTRYRVSYCDDDPTGRFVPLARPPYEEIDPSELGAASTQSFTDDFTLTGGPPWGGVRYFRIEVVR